jgi:hypothetical protein
MRGNSRRVYQQLSGLSSETRWTAKSTEFFGIWLAALDDFRNWVGLGLEAREKK